MSRVITAQIKPLVRAGGWLALAGVLALLGAVFLTLALFIALAQAYGPVMAAAGIGLAFLAVAVLAVIVARSKRGVDPAPTSGETVTVGALLDAFVEGQKAGRDSDTDGSPRH